MTTAIVSTDLVTSSKALNVTDPLGVTTRVIVGTVYLSLSLLSLVLNFLLVVIFIRYHGHYKKKAFFLITWQLIVGDVVTVALQLALAVPITFSGLPIYGTSWLIHLVAAFDTTAYYVIQFFNLVMAIYQASVFWSARLNDYFFSPPMIYVFILLTYMAALIPPFSQFVTGCYKEFAVTGNYGYPTCSPLGKQVNQYWTWVKTVLPVFIILLYISIFIHLRCLTKLTIINNPKGKMSPKKENSARQMRLLLQCFLICGSLEVQNLISNNIFSILSITDEWTMHIVDFTRNGISIFNTGIAPLVMFIFNNDVQWRMKELLRTLLRKSTPMIRILGMKVQTQTEMTVIVVGNTMTRSTFSHFTRHSSIHV